MIKDSNISRSKFLSVVIQPRVEANNWLNCESEETFNDLLLNCSFPLYTEIIYALNNVEGLTANTLNSVKPEVLRVSIAVKLNRYAYKMGNTGFEPVTFCL